MLICANAYTHIYVFTANIMAGSIECFIHTRIARMRLFVDGRQLIGRALRAWSRAAWRQFII